MTRNRLRSLALVAAVLCAPSVISAQDAKSAVLAGELATLLDAARLDSVAARHGDAQDEFVGALYFPGSQLLVAKGRFAAPERASVLLGQKSYRDIYIDLNSAALPATRVFISDLGADGLRFKRENNRPSDSADVAAKSYRFDGDWGKARMSREEYTAIWQATDEQYTQMLQSLVAQLKK